MLERVERLLLPRHVVVEVLPEKRTSVVEDLLAKFTIAVGASTCKKIGIVIFHTECKNEGMK